MESAAPQSALIAADNEPLRWRDLFGVVAALGVSDEANIKSGAEPVIPSFRVSNQALRGLGWQPHYGTVRSGLVAEAEHGRTR
jgi:hypothetical protein